MHGYRLLPGKFGGSIMLLAMYLIMGVISSIMLLAMFILCVLSSATVPYIAEAEACTDTVSYLVNSVLPGVGGRALDEGACNMRR